MKKLLLQFTTALLILISEPCLAQYYTFSHSTSTYSNLSSPVVVSAPYWDDFSVFTVVMPFPFTFYGTSFDTIYVTGGFYGFTYDGAGSFGDYEIASYEYSELKDLGAGASTISYQTTGIAPNRIFKIETNNAGFVNDTFTVSPDYCNLQAWFFETSNILEIHYGPNSVLDPLSWEIPGTSGPGVIIARDATTFFGLSGPASNPNATTTFVSYCVTGAPPDGIVYRFTPGTTGIESMLDNNMIRIYPNPSAGKIFIDASAQNSKSEMKVYNNLGQIVHQEIINFNEFKIQIDLNLSPGIYTACFENSEGRLSKKLIIQ